MALPELVVVEVFQRRRTISHDINGDARRQFDGSCWSGGQGSTRGWNDAWPARTIRGSQEDTSPTSEGPLSSDSPPAALSRRCRFPPLSDSSRIALR